MRARDGFNDILLMFQSVAGGSPSADMRVFFSKERHEGGSRDGTLRTRR